MRCSKRLAALTRQSEAATRRQVVLQGGIALFVGLFFVAQIWLAIIESCVGPFASNAARACSFLVSLALPTAVVAVPWLRNRPQRPRVPAYALAAAALVTTIGLFEAIRPFHPDHDDTFRAGFVHAVLGTGFPPSLSWWSAAATGHVHYYVLVEAIIAQVAALLPSASPIWLYVHQLKVAYIVCNVLLGVSIARDLGFFDRMATSRRGAVVAELALGWCALVMLVFGATPFDLAVVHVLGVSQSAIVHTALLLLVALAVRRPYADQRERLLLEVTIWTLPAVLAEAKFPFVPAFLAGLAVYWIMTAEFRERPWRAFVLPAYSAAMLMAAMNAIGLFSVAGKHPLILRPLLLLRAVAPHWFHFEHGPLWWRVGAAFGLYAVPMLLAAWLASRGEPITPAVRQSRIRALVLVAIVMLAGYAASATVTFVDREGANELYWFVQGWSALNLLVFVTLVGTRASWLKVAMLPLAFYAVHANWTALRTMSAVNAPLDETAAAACNVVRNWAQTSRVRRDAVIADPFDRWDFAACSTLPTLAPPDDRYDHLLRDDPRFAVSRLYMQTLETAPLLSAPPPELRPLLARFSHVLIIRPRGRPIVDSAAHLIAERAGLLFYDWPRR